MKKVAAIVLGLSLSLALAACGAKPSTSVAGTTSVPATSETASTPESSSEAGSTTEGEKNGVYMAELDTPSNGWTSTLTATYEDGKLVKAEYDGYNDEGVLKSTQGEDVYPMQDAEGNPFPPTTWIPMINENLEGAGEADKFDFVTGATGASTAAQQLLRAIEERGVEGETIVVSAEG